MAWSDKKSEEELCSHPLTQHLLGMELLAVMEASRCVGRRRMAIRAPAA